MMQVRGKGSIGANLNNIELEPEKDLELMPPIASIQYLWCVCHLFYFMEFSVLLILPIVLRSVIKNHAL
jgi:hypothetical protein